VGKKPDHFFWTRNVVKRSICHDNVCPFVCLSQALRYGGDWGQMPPPPKLNCLAPGLRPT